MIAHLFLLLLAALFVALWACFFLLLAYKWGIVEYLQTHGGKFISEMAHCDFCMSWWLCFVISLVMLCISGDTLLLAVPFLATPIARRML